MRSRWSLIADQQHDAFVVALLADAPLAVQRVRDVFDRFAIERINGDDGHLDTGGLFDCAAVGFELRARRRSRSHERNR